MILKGSPVLPGKGGGEVIFFWQPHTFFCEGSGGGSPEEMPAFKSDLPEGRLPCHFNLEAPSQHVPREAGAKMPKV